MKARFKLWFADYPVVEVAPDAGMLDSIGGRIEVHFIKQDRNTGAFEVKPFVRVNVSFGDLTAREAGEWSDILLKAACIADKIKPDQSSGLHPVFNEAWAWVENWKAQN